MPVKTVEFVIVEEIREMHALMHLKQDDYEVAVQCCDAAGTLCTVLEKSAGGIKPEVRTQLCQELRGILKEYPMPTARTDWGIWAPHERIEELIGILSS